MLDWGYVAASSLWILGLAIILANLSYHDWLADRSGRRLRELLGSSSHVIGFSVGMIFFSLGLLLLRPFWFEKIAWAIIASAFIALTVKTWKRP